MPLGTVRTGEIRAPAFVPTGKAWTNDPASWVAGPSAPSGGRSWTRRLRCELATPFDVPVVPCVAIVGASALLNLVLQIAFNPMQRLEPVYAAALLAINIVELAGLLYFTGGLENPFSFMFLAPVLISATALPVRLTIALGLLAVACASVSGCAGAGASGSAPGAAFEAPAPLDAAAVGFEADVEEGEPAV